MFCEVNSPTALVALCCEQPLAAVACQRCECCRPRRLAATTKMPACLLLLLLRMALTILSPLPSFTAFGWPHTQIPLVSVSRVCPTPKPTSAAAMLADMWTFSQVTATALSTQ